MILRREANVTGGKYDRVSEFNQRAAIATVVYWVIKIVRLASGDNEKFKRFIPLMAAGLGAVCGVICHYAVPSIIPSTNAVVAVVIGGASGLSATGVNQLIKQLTDKSNKTDEKPDDADSAAGK